VEAHRVVRRRCSHILLDNRLKDSSAEGVKFKRCGSTRIDGRRNILLAFAFRKHLPVRVESQICGRFKRFPISVQTCYRRFYFKSVGWDFGYCGHLLAYCTSPRMIGDGDCGEIGGMKIGSGNRSTRRKNLSQRHFVHHKSHMTIPGFEPGQPRWETSYYLFFICAVGLWVLRPLLACCTSPG
jgi:hypothetical protein